VQTNFDNLIFIELKPAFEMHLFVPLKECLIIKIHPVFFHHINNSR